MVFLIMQYTVLEILHETVHHQESIQQGITHSCNYKISPSINNPTPVTPAHSPP